MKGEPGDPSLLLRMTAHCRSECNEESPSSIMEIIIELKRRFPNAVLADGVAFGHPFVQIEAARLREVMQFLKNNQATPFEQLLDVCGVDYLGDALRFECVYHLYSMSQKRRLRVTARIPEDACHIASVIDIWPSADWFEREAFDMFGIRFDGHPKLERLLMWDEFEGHPLRKDYPLNKRQPIPTSKEIL